MDDEKEMPNMFFVDDVIESHQDVIDSYFEMIMAQRDKPDVIKELLEYFFDDVNYWTVRTLMIEQTKYLLGNLEELTKYENEFIDEEESD